MGSTLIATEKTSKPLKKLCIVIPCLNEERHIEACVQSIFACELPPNTSIEVHVVDGMSNDKTREIVKGLQRGWSNLFLLDNPARIQSCALNKAISLTDADFIVRIDAHAKYPVNYLKLCFETITRTGADNVGGVVITHPGDDGLQASLVQALTTHKFGVGNSGFRVGAEEGVADTVPYGCFRREVFERVGLFDERLVRAQDYEFNRRIAASKGKVWLNPNIQVDYYNIRTVWAFLRKQIVMEAPYNAYMWYLAPYSFAPRHAITGLFALGVIVGGLASMVSSWIRFAYLSVLCLYALLAIASSLQQAVRYRSCYHVFVLPFCFFLFHFLHGSGLLTGLALLAAGKAPVQKMDEPWPGAGRRRALDLSKQDRKVS